MTVDESVRTFWNQISDVLRDRISAQDWCSWFAGAGVAELSAHQIVIEVANDFAVRWVEERFREILEQAVAQSAGIPLDVVIRARAVTIDDTRPHERLMHAARTSSVEVDEPAPSSPNVMTDEQLRAELAASDVLPSVRLEAGVTAQEAATSPASTAAAALDARVTGVQQLSDRYRFETFVIGPGNQMVHAAALQVAENPAQSYNPLFIHGSTGLGKTHLLHAIGNFVRDTRPEAQVAYVTTEQFLARFMQAIQQSKAGGAGRDLRDRFKAYFRGVDVLLMDDVQFLAGKGSWLQEELFHIFNDLHQGGRQIVLTSDCKPERIPQLEDRLRTRFAWGLIADIDTPDRETRIGILRKKAQLDGLPQLPEEVAAAIADRITTNVRELEGALTRVVALASLSNRPITYELAVQVLESYAPAGGAPVTIERIQELVCEHFAIDRDELLSQRRTAHLVLPRHIGMYLSRTLLGASSLQVAARFNRKDHSTVLNAEGQIELKMRSDQKVHDLVVQLTEQLRGSAPHGPGVGSGR